MNKSFGLFGDQKLTSWASFSSFPKAFLLWISSLENGKYEKKYSLKTSRLLKERYIKDTNEDSEVEQDIIEDLQQIGVTDKNDGNQIVDKIKKIVKNGFVFKPRGLFSKCENLFICGFWV